MTEIFPECSICAREADWLRTRMPNEQQMRALCNRHYLALKDNNPVLASYYDVIASSRQIDAPPAADGADRSLRQQSGPDIGHEP